VHRRAYLRRTGLSLVVNGRFRGGYTTRHHGRPETGVHAIQMELACRGYIDEPDVPDEANWPTPSIPPAPRPWRASAATSSPPASTGSLS
jgi:N-formylglutamate deformylase